MDLWATLRLIGRRWYVLVAGLVVTIGLVLVVASSITPTYSAEVDLLLFTPTQAQPDVGAGVDPATVEQPQNPYLEYGSLQPLAEVVARVMMNDVVHDRLLKRSPAALDYTVERDAYSAAPLLMIQSQATTERRAVDFVEVVAEETRHQIQRQQRGVGADHDASAVAQSVTPEPRAETQIGSRLRAVIALSVLGIGLAVTACFVVDGAVNAAARRRLTAMRMRNGALDDHEAPDRSLNQVADKGVRGVADGDNCTVCGSDDCDDPQHALYMLESALLSTSSRSTIDSALGERRRSKSGRSAGQAH